MIIETIQDRNKTSKDLSKIPVGDIFICESAWLDTGILDECVVFIKIPSKTKTMCTIMDIDGGVITNENKDRKVITLYTKLIVSLDHIAQ